ncbi:ABC transporter substrate-binding protein [Stackebrandtia nassauensis]|uniref:Extracellular solute-binding protein family 5 n=1 Tax=Stackebrandtia nassauensis (strain DSM 44728 / CIP 108903 / NRRL B-16338 / NBRC 102104 / LLR-40K-21) TaxID=446470 RepID=D3QBI4_STANL|nr:ABC transporter substrate-binding protein [Stackebrandtia nassauensis]ADD42866.1 extracellular solute-binding protein family 5 [Stackebrandtia nassauensis DSM 44728]
MVYRGPSPLWRVCAGVAAVALALPVTACSASEDDRTLITSVDQTVENLNPLTTFFSLNYQVNNLIYVPLIRFGAKDYSPVEGLATKWEPSNDNRVWTYTIRDDAKWSDGKDITAADAAFTYQLLMDDKALRASHSELVNNFASVKAPSADKLVIEIKKPSSQMTALDTPIVPKHVWEKVDNPSKYKNTDFPVVSSGPFIATDFAVDEFIKFDANKDFFGGAPKYDKLVFQYYKTPEAAVQALHSGDVDLVGGLNPAQFKSLKGEDNIATNKAQSRSTTSITFNVGAKAQNGDMIGDGHPALRDSVVRQAMHASINKDRLIDKVQDGYAEPGVAYIPPIFDDYFWDPGDETVKFDIEAAGKKLDKAGYKKGSDGIRTMPDSDKKLEFRLLYHSDEPSYATIAEFLKTWWEELGVAIELDSADSTKLNDQLYAGQYDVIFSGWGVDPDPTPILALYACSSLPETAKSDERDTDTFYCNKDYDKLYEKQKASTDAEERAALVAEMQRIQYVDAPQVTLYYSNVLEAYRSDRWSGFDTQPADGGMIRGQEGSWGYASATPAAGGGVGGSGPLWGGIAAVVVVVAGVGLWWWSRRRRAASADERE